MEILQRTHIFKANCFLKVKVITVSFWISEKMYRKFVTFTNRISNLPISVHGPIFVVPKSFALGLLGNATTC